uniref:ATP synthase complex subunit 8 n=1 Tax=Scaphisoma boleti TaxID=1588438 RepID=A0A0S2M8A7_9COLE|nr:ATP synthase F0 subunit 8 [Scaphisoma boleti]
MPQMMPLNWILLFMWFIMIFMIFNSMIYFNFTYNPKKSNQLIKKTIITWKW